MDQNFLNGKEVAELLDICISRGIDGLGLNQPKATLIAILLNDMAENDGIPTRDELEAKSVIELREMLEDRDITGMGRQPKPILIDVLLNDYAKSVLTGVQATVTVTKDEEGKVSSTISVSCGGSQNDFDVSGHTVGEVAELLKEVLNIPENAKAAVNGNVVDYDYVLQVEDVLDFVQKAEKKG